MKKIMNILTCFILLLSFETKAEELVFHSDPKYINEYNNKYSFMLGLNPSMTKTNQLMNAHFSYSRETAEKFWWDYSFSIIKGNFDKFTTNNASATGETNARMVESTNSSTQILGGIGLLYRTEYSQSLIPVDSLYEIVGASLTYNVYKDSNASKTFTGPGFIAKFSMLKKISDYLSFGGNIIYNLAVVKRGQDSDQETSSQRSLTLSHVTVGFDLSIFL
jgi:hypothetical protein